MISNLMMMLRLNKNYDINVDEIRPMVLSSIRAYKVKHQEKYGEMIICCDDKNYWRRQVFPYYKMNRKKTQKESLVDWHEVFAALEVVKQELIESFPYTVIQVEAAEADDVIASICHRYGELGIMSNSAEQILVLSSDKDFGQLQKYANVDQYMPIQKRWQTVNNPERFIHEHILAGDSSDGVPNFLSDDDTFVNDTKRQTSLTAVRIDKTNGLSPEEFCTPEELVRYERNKLLIDLDMVPENIQEDAVNQYSDRIHKGRGKLLNYFIQHKLKQQLQNIQDF